MRNRSVSNHNKAVSVACLSMLLFSGSAVNIPKAVQAVQDPAKNLLSSSAAANATPEVAPKVEKPESEGGASAAKDGDPVSPKIPANAKTSVFNVMEDVNRNRPIEPKIGVKNPVIVPKVTYNVSKTHSIPFASPDIKTIGAPRNFRATAYSLRGRTASGNYVRRGIVAADPRVLPLGSVVHVTAGSWSGVYTVHDTGGVIKGNIIDVWVPSTKEAMQFGRRRVTIKVLRYGNR